MYPIMSVYPFSAEEIAEAKSLISARPRGCLTDEFIKGWNAAANHFRQTPPLSGLCLILIV